MTIVGGNAHVKLPSAVATAAATQAPKSAATIAAPTRHASRGVASAGKKPTANENSNGGNNANASNMRVNTNATTKATKATKPNVDMNAKTTAPFALNDVTAGSVHHARQIFHFTSKAHVRGRQRPQTLYGCQLTCE
ncbi:hypothetical protein PF008_g7376 [Phytophthora fragariae]|uniref:Uncharacterized protein n=1 Tax=Phytophthora fragariae TaxID=53985 RepID=A0A6G0S2T0_9STRA|nr:hypothetical protein PF008_g7376 [Phytophthora fragariae]